MTDDKNEYSLADIQKLLHENKSLREKVKEKTGAICQSPTEEVTVSAITVNSGLTEKSKNSLTFSEQFVLQALTSYIKINFFPKMKFVKQEYTSQICKRAVHDKKNGITIPKDSSVEDFVNVFSERVTPIFTSLRRACEMNVSVAVRGKWRRFVPCFLLYNKG